MTMTSLILLHGLLGGLGGLAYFALLRASLQTGRWRLVAGTMLLRLAAAAGLFWLAAQSGAWPLLAALAGFLAARGLMLRRARGLS